MIVKDGPFGSVMITDEGNWSGPCPTCASLRAEAVKLRKEITRSDQLIQSAVEWRRAMSAYDQDRGRGGDGGKAWSRYMNALSALNTITRAYEEGKG